MIATDKSILLVEDEAILAMNEKRELEEYGYNIQLVHNGENAIKATYLLIIRT